MINFEDLLKKQLKPDPPKGLITFDYYRDYISEDEDQPPKFLFSIDWMKVEDHWRQRYMFDRPRYSSEEMERHWINNKNRCQYFRISLKICSLTLFLDIKLKKVGNVYHGRLIDEEASAKRWKERKEKREAKNGTKT